MSSDSEKNKILIQVSEGKKIPGYSVVQIGIDSSGRYKEIQTPEGNIEKVYCIGLKDLERFFVDKYNTLHNYRRNNDEIVLYYNIDTGEIVVLAVLPGDDLSENPFKLKEKFVVTKEMLENPKIGAKGILPITKDNLLALKQMELLSDETERVIYFNRKNPGFYL